MFFSFNGHPVPAIRPQPYIYYVHVMLFAVSCIYMIYNIKSTKRVFNYILADLSKTLIIYFFKTECNDVSRNATGTIIIV